MELRNWKLESARRFIEAYGSSLVFMENLSRMYAGAVVCSDLELFVLQCVNEYSASEVGSLESNATLSDPASKKQEKTVTTTQVFVLRRLGVFEGDNFWLFFLSSFFFCFLWFC